MPVYSYKAIGGDGKTLKGTLVAANKVQVAEMLAKRKSHPVMIEEKQKVSFEFNFKGKINAREISLFCRQFSAMLNSGVNIITTLDILRAQIENKRLKTVVGEVYEDVQKGFNLSEALRKYPEDFPALLVNMVEAGEASGTLDVVMKRMSQHYEKEYKLNNKIKNAMVYPIVLLVVSLAVVFFLVTFVLPAFISMFTTSGVELPLPTRILLFSSELIRAYWYLVAIAIIALVVFFKKYLDKPEVRQRFDQLKLKIYFIKKINEKIIASRFTRTFATLMSSGIPLLQALENVAKVVNNVIIEEGILKIRDNVRRGQTLGMAVQTSGLFPPMVDNMIRIGEEAGTIDDLMDKSADFYDEEVEIILQRLVTLFEPIMIVFMGVIIGFIVISIALPLFDMVKTVK